MARAPASSLLAAAAAAAALATAASPAAAPRQLSAPASSLAIGGGGFTTGLVPTPRSASGAPTVFMRTDVGGVYRLLPDGQTWRPLTDGLSFRDRNRYGGEAIAVSAEDAARVWVVLGAYFDEPGCALVLASEDAGETWRAVSPPNWSVRGGANNSTYRSLGERLVAHPRDDRGVLLYGSFLDGLWRTETAGAPAPTWAQVACGAASGLPCGLPIGVLALAFDAASNGGDTVYASAPTAGVLVSTDAGLSWRALAGAPIFAKRLAIALTYGGGADGRAIVAPSASASPLFASATDGVYSFDGAAAWSRAEPLGPGVAFAGVDVNPFDPLDAIANSEQVAGLARTRDGGRTWQHVMRTYEMIYELPWWDASVNTTEQANPPQLPPQLLTAHTPNPAQFGHNATPVDFVEGMCGNVRFGTAPSDAPGTTLYLGDSWNTWRAENFGAATWPPPPSGELVALVQLPRGHEEVFVLSMAAPHTPSPFLVTGTADLSGVVHFDSNWSLYTPFSWFGPGDWGAEGTGVSYTEATVSTPRDGVVPARMAVAHCRAFATGNGGSLVRVSDDGARTWRATALNASVLAPAEVLGISIGAWAPDAMVALVGNDVPWRSTDGGATWARAAGIPSFPYPLMGYSGNRYNQSRPLTADRPLVAPTTLPAGATGPFFYADCASGSFFTSIDGGATFAPRAALAFAPSPRCALEPHPTPAGGALWLALDAGGLLFTAAAEAPGASFSRIGAVAVAHAVAVGAPRAAGEEPVVYAIGILSGAAPDDDLHLVVSLDRGVTWADLRASNNKMLGNWPEVVVASRAHFGVVGVGSFGRGAFFMNASAIL